MAATESAPRPRRDDETPSRRRTILLAAERLFAQRGYHAVSLRDIAAEAGVQVALVGYHYGAKHQLYHAIFESWMPSIRERRALLDAAMAAPEPATRLPALLQAFAGPLVAMHGDEQGRWFATMAARDLAAPTPEADQAQREFFDPMAHAFIDALQQIFPRHSRADVAWCYQFMLGAVLHFLSDQRIERLSRGGATAADPARLPMLIQFLAAGFRGALGDPVTTPRSPR